MKVPFITVTYNKGRVIKVVYDNGNGMKIDLTEIMFISKIGWEHDAQRGVSISTISFDAEMYSETK